MESLNDTDVSIPTKGILDLPITLLESLASFLSVKDRVCLVCTCRQLAQLGDTSAALWASVELAFNPTGPHLASLARWLRCKADLVGCLRLEADEGFSGVFDDSSVWFLLGTLAGSRSLHHLVLREVVEQAWVSGWAAGLPALRKLDVLARGRVSLTPSCSQLTGLASLQLVGIAPAYSPHGLDTPALPPGSLPHNLQRLQLGQVAYAISPSISSVTGLRLLAINNIKRGPPLRIAGLDSLPHLENLILAGCQLDAPPTQLSALTKLRLLDLSSNFRLGAARGGWEVLLALPQLCCLSLADCGLQALPHYVAKLSGIRILDICCNPHLRALPPAAFWPVLLALGVDMDTLCLNWAAVPQQGGESDGEQLPLCRSMARLEFLVLDGTRPPPVPVPVAAAGGWGAAIGRVLDELPALGRLLLSEDAAEQLASEVGVGGSGSILDELKQRPRLAVHHKPTGVFSLAAVAWEFVMPAEWAANAL